MMQSPYSESKGSGRNPMPHLGYDPGTHDLVVAEVHDTLHRFLTDESKAINLWGWDSKSLKDQDRYRAEQLLRSFLYQEDRILAALRRLDEEAKTIDTADRGATPAPEEADDEYAGYYREEPWFADAGRLKTLAQTLNTRAATRTVKQVVAQLPKPLPDAAIFNAAGHATLVDRALEAWEGGPRSGAATAAESSRDPEKTDLFLGPRKTGRPGGSASQSGLNIVENLVHDYVREHDDQLDDAARRAFQSFMMNRRSNYVVTSDGTSDRGVIPWSLIDFLDPDVARNIGKGQDALPGSDLYAWAPIWRFTDSSYGADVVPDPELRELIDLLLAVQAEYQLQCFLINRELTRIVNASGQEYEFLQAAAAAKAAQEAKSTLWGILGDVFGVISAVAGVLALIPVLTPLAGPIAVVTATASLGFHVADAAIRGDWDAETIAGLAADALGALPVVGALGKAAKAGKLAMRSVGKVGVAARASGRAFLAATGGAKAAKAGRLSTYVGSRGAEAIGATAKQGKIAAKVIQGSVELATQVPTVLELAGADTGAAAPTATSVELGQGMIKHTGDWVEMGSALTRKGGQVSLAQFARTWA
ncbi:hypothetical protein ACIA78_38345 [Streptomyces xanthochromogenes]|uniref:hypothetical protein n=1 Tax=Streptomyces xanthochromogenes TaxID=67384 RepID=UPI003793C6D7